MITSVERNIGQRWLIILSGLVGVFLLVIEVPSLVARLNLNRALIACTKLT